MLYSGLFLLEEPVNTLGIPWGVVGPAIIIIALIAITILFSTIENSEGGGKKKK